MKHMPNSIKKVPSNRQIGTFYEELAREVLQKKGYHILTSNYRCRLGEIDVIASINEWIVFVEVKYRKAITFGYPREAVTPSKIKHIKQVAEYYLLTTVGYEAKCRFDVIEILDNEVMHLENAF